MARARQTRHSVRVDTAFTSYRGDARGYVYFYIDRPDQDERSLVRADQVALELYWRAPDRATQRIVGLRNEDVLPTRIRYHLDHLTVVQDDFGDFIRMGEGDEVAAVLHPFGPGSETWYDFRVADSLSIAFADGSEVRVLEVRVRPKDVDRPGFVGSVYVDPETAAIVRMSFTFTPASYVDPTLDYIRVSLENARWLGRYWLPYRQEAELRRELPVLDFVAGSVIRARYEIGGYVFNEEVPRDALFGGPVSSAPADARRSFPFERGIFDDVEQQGLTPPPSFDRIRADAVEMVGRRRLSGLAPLRLHLASVSDGLRYDRAEGLFLGAGLTVRPGGALQLRPSAGYAFGRARPSGALEASVEPDQALPTVRVYWDALRDLGQAPGASMLLNSVSAALDHDDLLDPYFVRGGSLGLLGTGRGARTRVALRVERHVGAADVLSQTPGTDFRPVRGIVEGDLVGLDASTRLDDDGGRSLSVRATGARLASRSFARLVLDAAWEREGPGRSLGWSVGASAGAVTARAPAQSLFLLGGRGTLPGHGYRAFEGDGFWLARAEGTHPLLQPWVGIRALAAAGATYLDARTLPAGWLGRDSAGVRASLGAGLALGWNVVRLDLWRGLGRGGGWELVVSADPDLTPWM